MPAEILTSLSLPKRLGEPSEIRLQTSAELLGLLLGQHGDKSTDVDGSINRIRLPSEIDSRERAKARAVRVPKPRPPPFIPCDCA